MNFEPLLSYVIHIPQQLHEFLDMVLCGFLSQFHLMEFLLLVVIILGRQIFILEILLKFLPFDLPLFNLVNFYKVFPLDQSSVVQTKEGDSSLLLLGVIMNFKVSFHSQKPSFHLLTHLIYSVEGRRSSLPRFLPMNNLANPLGTYRLFSQEDFDDSQATKFSWGAKKFQMNSMKSFSLVSLGP